MAQSLLQPDLFVLGDLPQLAMRLTVITHPATTVIPAPLTRPHTGRRIPLVLLHPSVTPLGHTKANPTSQQPHPHLSPLQPLQLSTHQLLGPQAFLHLRQVSANLPQALPCCLPALLLLPAVLGHRSRAAPLAQGGGRPAATSAQQPKGTTLCRSVSRKIPTVSQGLALSSTCAESHVYHNAARNRTNLLLNSRNAGICAKHRLPILLQKQLGVSAGWMQHVFRLHMHLHCASASMPILHAHSFCLVRLSVVIRRSY